MTRNFTSKMRIAVGLILYFVSSGFYNLHAQVSLTATVGTPTGSFLTINDAFTAINAGTHQGAIVISINGNTTEPVLAVPLLASGQGTTLYASILIKPTIVSVVSATPAATNGAVLILDGADNVTIDGSIAVGGTTRDLTIQNLAANTLTFQHVIRLIGRTTLGLGAENNAIRNVNIIGSTAGNSGFSGSTVNSTYGIYCGGSTATSTNTTAGINYDNLVIENNSISQCYVGITVNGGTSPNQCDNVLITRNEIGSATVANSIGLRGIYMSQHVNAIVSENTISNVSANTSITTAGIELAGTASSNCTFRRNSISEVSSISTSGFGAYGINLSGGNGHVVSNNVIHSIYTTNYSGTSTTFNAFGIRLASGTGHEVYYNSVNIAGNYTTAPTSLAASAAFCVSSTAVAFTANNNIFNNVNSSVTTGSQTFFAMWFPTNYNFLNANLNNNYYGVTNSPNHFIGKIGTTAANGNFATLPAWQAVSQVNNPTNDANSFPASTAPAPYASATNLLIPAGTVTPLESGGIVIGSLGAPNIDFLGTLRPAGAGTAPDIGAFEFAGVLGDFNPPVLVSVLGMPSAPQCIQVPRVVSAIITDASNVASAVLNYSFAGVTQTPIAMALSSGTAMNGTWSGTIPAASAAGVNVDFSVQATDANGNTSGSLSGASYTDNYLNVTASQDVSINAGASATISATSNDGAFNRLLISEVVQNKNGTGDLVASYPAYIPTTDQDFVELINFRSTSFDASGYTMTLYGGVNGSFTIPSGAIVPSGGVLTLAFSTSTNSPADNYYAMGLTTTTSGIALGYVLRDTDGGIVDVVATNGYTFLPASGVSSSDWIGNIPSSSGFGGVRRTAPVDNNTASNWTISSASNLTNIGTYNVEIPITPFTAVMTWTNSANAMSSTSNPLTETFSNAGVFVYTATYNDGTCSAFDTVVITVIAPTVPVADFSATPLSTNAGLDVTFSDLSTNIPSTWSWVITPSAGVVFANGTSASSQNPVVTFSNAGTYTVQLTSGNSAGTDDTTKIDYIVVGMCAATANFAADSDIGNVTFAGINQGIPTPVVSNATATGTYSNFNTGMQATVEKGATYPITLSQITSGVTFYDAWFNVFIDWNGDGSFDPITERVYTSTALTDLANPTQTATITVPLDAVVGPRFMRVMLNEDGSATSAPCSSFSFGEIEDYIVNVTCPTAILAPTAASIDVCEGSTATLTAVSSYTGTTVNWYNSPTGDSIVSTGLSYTTPVVTATTTFYVSDSISGCAPSMLTAVTVTALAPTTALVTEVACETFTWALNGSTYTTSGMYVDTIANAAGCDSIITLNLTINNGAISSVTETACDSYTWPINGVTYSVSGTYIDTIATSAGCDSIITLNLTINTLILTVTNTSPTLTSNEVGATYQWIDCSDNSAILGETGATFVATANGTYAVIVTKNNCSDTSACEIVANVGLTEIKNTLNVLYSPNPTSEFVRIDFSTSAAAVVEVLDATGKVVVSKKDIVSGDQLDFRNLERGVYFVRVQSDKGSSLGRIVKN